MGIQSLLTQSASCPRLTAVKVLPATLLLTGLATRASAMGVGKCIVQSETGDVARFTLLSSLFSLLSSLVSLSISYCGNDDDDVLLSFRCGPHVSFKGMLVMMQQMKRQSAWMLQRWAGTMRW